MTMDELHAALRVAQARSDAEWDRHEADQYRPGLDPGWVPSIERVQAAGSGCSRLRRLHHRARRGDALCTGDCGT